MPDRSVIPPPDASRQIAFHQLLVSKRKTWLMDALAEALGRVEPGQLKEQLVEFVPADAQQIIATTGTMTAESPAILAGSKPTIANQATLPSAMGTSVM